MKYSLVIHHDEGSAYGVIVPDIPGCHSAGDTIEEAFENVVEAIDGHIELLVEDGKNVPKPIPMQEHVDNPDYQGGIWGFVDVDVTKYMGKSKKINVTLPEYLIDRIDQYVKEKPEFHSRSGFLASISLEKLG